MKTATDMIQIFTPEAIARKIGGDASDVLTVLKCCVTKGLDEAIPWVMHMDYTKPWPLADTACRGDALVDRITDQLCTELHALTSSADDHSGPISKESKLQLRREILLKRGWNGFEQREFHRNEIARWLAAFGMHSAFNFGQEAKEPDVQPQQEVADAPAPETKEERQDRRLQACIDAGLNMNMSALSRLPDGIADVAKQEGVTRQSFTADVKAALERRSNARKAGS